MADPTRASGDTVSELLGEDHRRLDAVLGDAKRRLREGAAGAAAERFAAFRAGLERHIEVEERDLFPAFEERTGMRGAGPTEVMRAEHREIQRLLGEIAAALAREGSPDCTALFGALTGVLLAHNGKEEKILYPMSDRVLEDSPARAEILRRIRAL